MRDERAFKALERVERALARIDAASARLGQASAAEGEDVRRLREAHEALREKVRGAIGQIDVLLESEGGR